MAEYIERTSLMISMLERNLPWMNMGDALAIVENAPAEDVVHVVCCKDCKKWSGVALGSRCKHFSFPPLAYCYTNADDFCSRGERNEG